MNYEQIANLQYHLREALRYLENAPDSPFPGFDCGLCEVQLAHEIVEDLVRILWEQKDEKS